MQRPHAEGFPRYCFKAHESSKSLPVITMNETGEHLHIVSPHNPSTVDWTAHAVVLKVAEWCSSLPFGSLLDFPQWCYKTAHFIYRTL